MSIWKELTDAWVWKECWGDFDSVEESINMSKKMQLYWGSASTRVPQGETSRRLREASAGT